VRGATAAIVGALVFAGCALFGADPPQTPADAVVMAADAHAKACDLYAAACMLDSRSCNPHANAACAVECGP
jgi:PBP1b-binding outer membrane lipoprotein LpoB